MRLVIQERLLHDGRDYAPGEELELPAEQALPLVGSGVASAPESDPPAPAPADMKPARTKRAKA